MFYIYLLAKKPIIYIYFVCIPILLNYFNTLRDFLKFIIKVLQNVSSQLTLQTYAYDLLEKKIMEYCWSEMSDK